ncbi:hypothetical protein G7Y89_g5032 [Cudoniella acicularis]|uniref:DNA damage-responsive protein 48 n=1 Tax=Cudoniella acicularis TaxID=354080 RepID=A0A8H4RPL6_9HELO|nr:hypothetical protein G7Y89_g5032 [Cudoniella acicularis]
MDFLNKFTGGEDKNQSQNGGQQQQQYSSPTQNQGQHSNQQQGGGNGASSFFSGIGDKLNTAAGGGRESEKNEDMLDKGIDMFQEKVLGQGPQDNESAVEQAKDEQISDFIRGKFRDTTGKDIPIKDKKTRFG